MFGIQASAKISPAKTFKFRPQSAKISSAKINAVFINAFRASLFKANDILIDIDSSTVVSQFLICLTGMWS